MVHKKQPQSQPNEHQEMGKEIRDSSNEFLEQPSHSINHSNVSNLSNSNLNVNCKQTLENADNNSNLDGSQEETMPRKSNINYCYYRFIVYHSTFIDE